ncbi:MAG: helix-turn-helix domain-containing protein, partial [Acidimicrobiales bacterium]
VEGLVLDDEMTAAIPELMDMEILAERLGDSVRHIRRLVAERRIPYLKVGRLIRFDPAEIVEWLDAARQPDLAQRRVHTVRAVNGHRA